MSTPTPRRGRRLRRLVRTTVGAGLVALTAIVVVDATGGAQSSGPTTTSSTAVASTTTTSTPEAGESSLPEAEPAVANEPGAEPIEARPRLTG